MTPRKKPAAKHPEPEPEPEEDQDNEETRTQVETEYRGAKVRVSIGRGGSMLLWAIAWAVVVLSTLIGLTMLVSVLDKLGVLGCTFSILLYLASCASAYWRP